MLAESPSDWRKNGSVVSWGLAWRKHVEQFLSGDILSNSLRERCHFFPVLKVESIYRHGEMAKTDCGAHLIVDPA